MSLFFTHQSLIPIPHTGPQELEVHLSPRAEFFRMVKPTRYCILKAGCSLTDQEYLNSRGEFELTCINCWFDTLQEVETAMLLYKYKQAEQCQSK